MAPMLLALLKMPVARARSWTGNQSLTVLIAAGKMPPSASPRPRRATLNPGTVPDQPVRGGGDAPEEGGPREAALDAEPVHDAAAEEVAEGVGQLEAGTMLA